VILAPDGVLVTEIGARPLNGATIVPQPHDSKMIKKDNNTKKYRMALIFQKNNGSYNWSNIKHIDIDKQ